MSSLPSIILLFTGQGSQAVGMGRSLAESSSAAGELLERASAELDFDLREVMFKGPEEVLTRTSRCQPALYVHGLMCVEALREKLGDELRIEAAAGLSLGEFTAHAAAGSFGFLQGLRLVAKRGQFMEEACEATEGSMAAMIGGDEDNVRHWAEACGLDFANLNCPGQIVVSGSREGIAKAVSGAKEAGVRMAKEIKVAGAYHSSLMQSAQDKLAAELKEVEFGRPAFPVISNLTARPATEPGEIRRTLEAQVTGSVRWSNSMDYLLEKEGSHFLEAGPGKVNTGLMGRIRKGTFCLPLGEAEELEAALAALKQE